MKVHILMIHHRYGENVSAHTTAKGAEEALEKYVEAEWEGELREPYPKGSTTAVKDYFERMEREWAEILEAPILKEGA